jgi:hypothetical protein
MTRYIRYQEADSDGVHRYGRVQDGASGPVVQELERAPWDLPDGSPPDEPGEIDRTHPLDSVRLLAPCEPSKVIAVGRNFRSHLGSRPGSAGLPAALRRRRRATTSSVSRPGTT